MARYYMHLRGGTDVALDPEGYEFATLEELQTGLLRNARDIIAGDVMRGVLNLDLRIDAETASGELVRSLPFQEALTSGTLQAAE